VGTVLNFEAALESNVCCVCGIEFAMPAYFVRKRREDHVDFHCPNGHPQHFTGETEAEKLKRQLANEVRMRENAEARASSNWKAKERADRQAAAARGQVTKIKHRVGHGVCPCCHRTFAQLASHMKEKHPDFAEESAT
jgi:hypothetical protein